MRPAQRISARVAREEERQRYTDLVNTQRTSEGASTWSIKSDNAMHDAAARETLKKLWDNHEKQLNMRRETLKKLLGEENLMYQKEFEAKKQMEPTLRMESLKKRADEVRQRREKEKEEFAFSMDLKKKMVACDKLRTLNSVEAAYEARIQRENDLEIKKKMTETAKIEEEISEKQLSSPFGEDEGAGKKNAKESMSKFKTICDNQLTLRKEVVKKEREKEIQEDELAKQRAEALRRQAKEEEEELYQKKMAIRKDLKEHNELYLTLKEEQRKREKEYEESIVQKAMIEEQHCAQEKIAKKEEMKKEMEESLLRDQSNKQFKKEMNMEEDKLLKMEQDRAWNKRLEMWGKEESQRKKLNQDAVQFNSNELSRIEFEKATRRQRVIDQANETQNYMDELRKAKIEQSEQKRLSQMAYNQELDELVKTRRGIQQSKIPEREKKETEDFFGNDDDEALQKQIEAKERRIEELRKQVRSPGRGTNDFFSG
eukprot:TRINITY_DN2777_c0_g1_i1.p1 TRINITY_DN2777_c0_g1~~TRINITY_DN2777_c0_g1_i1.p1  ORF type:complete len:486 (+),score=193.58 TRINITY_DN2777_c0_g1_i1:16-1473(+)